MANDDSVAQLQQAKVRDWFENKHGTEQWTSVYDFRVPIGESGPALYSCLAPVEHRTRALERTDWDLTVGHGTPGMVEYFGRGKESEVEYLRFGSTDGVEPIVVIREFPNHRDDYPEVVEELRHAFNLYEDRMTGSFYEINDAGDEVEAIRVSPNHVEIRTSLLRRFQALKGMDLLLFISSDVWVPSTPETNAAIPDEMRQEDDRLHTHLYGGTSGFRDERVFSRLIGKKVIPPLDREACGLWPYEPEEEHVSFMLSEDEAGRPVEFTSDPEQLANNFGKNPDAPHYLTPVFFDARVLEKYYENHDRYEVSDGYLRAHGSWGTYIDNDHTTGVVSVWLGDLGRDLPLSEQRHWRSFNVLPPKYGLSETAVRRQLFGQFTDAKSPEHRLKFLYEQVNKAWQERFGWPLFKPLNRGDEHVLTSLRVPLAGTDREFDTQVLNVAKLLVDSINEADIATAIGKGPKDEKGIAKLDRYLTSLGVSDPATVTAVMRTVQGLRSKGSAHRKAEDFDLAKAGLDPNDLRAAFVSLLEQLADALTALLKMAEQNAALGKPSESKLSEADG